MYWTGTMLFLNELKTKALEEGFHPVHVVCVEHQNFLGHLVFLIVIVRIVIDHHLPLFERDVGFKFFEVSSEVFNMFEHGTSRISGRHSVARGLPKPRLSTAC